MAERRPETPRFIHLHGPAGIGKSTIAQMYADRHPMVLNLDIDRIRTLIGGWREAFSATGTSARALAHSMARTHLGSGHDVVMPQLVARLEEVQRFADTALAAGARFCEVALMDSREAATSRFARRGTAAGENVGDWAGWHQQVTGLVAASGGDALLAQMYDDLEDVLRQRPDVRIVRSIAGDPESTYDAVMHALSAEG